MTTGIPPGLKAIAPYLKIAEEHEKRDLAITYWCRLYAVQTGLNIKDKSPDSSAFFLKMMDWLESTKKLKHDDDTIANDVVAQAHIENYALKLFLWADNEDRCGRFNKNVVKSFYTAGFMYDIVSTFGEPSEEVMHHKKYAKWKCTYIHNCLSNGVTPVPGPVALEGEGDDESELSNSAAFENSLREGPSEKPPYPTGGLFSVPGTSHQPDTFNLPVPGAHAPPCTPNGAGQPPAPSPPTADQPVQESSSGVSLKPEDYHKAHKYCKWAGSSLQYEDAPTAITHLQKALRLLTTGQEE